MLQSARKLIKVPEITIFFWIIKLLTTAMGEVTSDFLVRQIEPVIAVAIGGIGLGVALILQFWMKKYIPLVYWLAVVMVAIFGTMAADVLHIGFGIPYLVSSLFFAIALGVVFLLWYVSEKTLSIHSIFTFRREIFYWTTVITTFALGTAVGDMTATTLHLGYFTSGVVFACLFALPALTYWKLKANVIATFWLCYIFTRPLGASFADWVGKAQNVGGLGIGTGQVSLILTVLIIGFVGYLSIQKKSAE